jgi:hypothetical protein
MGKCSIDAAASPAGPHAHAPQAAPRALSRKG